MKPYRDRSGNSGVSLYETGPEWIKLKFKTGDYIYLYDYTKPGKIHVEKMKALAVRGEDLATYVNKYVRDDYHFKIAK